MKTRFALIALAGALSLPAFAGPYLSPTTRGVQPLFGGATAGSTVAASTGAGAGEVRFVGGEIGYLFPDENSTLSRAEFLAQQARPEAAGTRDGWIAVGGQEGFRFVPQPNGLTRHEVLAATMMAPRAPTAVDGWLVVGGEVGAVFVGDSNPATQMQAFAPSSVRSGSMMDVPGSAGCSYAAGSMGKPADGRHC